MTYLCPACGAEMDVFPVPSKIRRCPECTVIQWESGAQTHTRYPQVTTISQTRTLISSGSVDGSSQPSTFAPDPSTPQAQTANRPSATTTDPEAKETA